MDRSELAQRMLLWELKKRELDEMAGIIENAVLQREETVVTGNILATYNSGRKSYDYEKVAGNASIAVTLQYTKTVEKTDWRKVALDGMGLELVEIPYTQSEPSVSLRLI